MDPQTESPVLQSGGQTPASPPLPAALNGTPIWEVPPEAIPHLDNLVIEDGQPVDSIFAEKQQRLLTAPLYAAWAGPGEGRTFQAMSNVGLFYGYKLPPLVPDAMLSLDVVPGDIRLKDNRSYF